MSILPLRKRAQILATLCESSSMRSINHVADASINTVSKPLLQTGEAGIAIHNEKVQGVKASRVQFITKINNIMGWSQTYDPVKQPEIED